MLLVLVLAASLAMCHGGALHRAQGIGEPRECVGSHCKNLKRLDLTDLLDQGLSSEELQASALVEPQVGNFSSYAGYFNTNSTAGNNMFFWYFPAQNGDPDAPTVLWLQGGPGGSSLFGMMVEMGPFRSGATPTDIDANPGSWNEKNGMIFIDNPVGAGFSYTTNNGYVTNEDEVAQNLQSELAQFFAVFPRLQKNKFFITGESYGGHYVPAIAAKLVANQQSGQQGSLPTVSGIAVGDGWIDPVHMIPAYPQMMYDFGLASLKDMETITAYCNKTVEQIHDGDYVGVRPPRSDPGPPRCSCLHLRPGLVNIASLLLLLPRRTLVA